MHEESKFVWRRAGLCVAVLSLLAACGGGGGGGGSTSSSATSVTSGTVTATNYSKLGSAAAAASADLNSTQGLSSDASSSVKGPATNDGASQVGALSDAALLTSTYFASQAKQILEQARASASTRSGLTKKQSYNSDLCKSGDSASGRYWTDIYLADPNKISSGDWVEIGYTDCKYAGLSVVIQGSFKLTFTQLESPQILTMQFNNLKYVKADGSTQIGYSGSVAMSVTGKVYSMTYTDFTVTRGTESHTYNFVASLDGSKTPPTMTIKQDIVVDGKKYTVSTTENLEIPSGASHPNKGQLQVKGADSSYTTVDMNDKSVDMKYYNSGTSTPAASASQPWTSVLNQ